MGEIMYPIYYLLHIPKTGGTTMLETISDLYEKDQVLSFSNYEDFQAKIRNTNINNLQWLVGHSYLGIVEQYISRPMSIITLLRDPIERVLSDYYHLVEGSHPLYSQFANVSLDDFIRSDKYISRTENVQTRYLTGPDSVPTNLELAKHNLRTKISYFGIMENYRYFFDRIVEAMHWDKAKYRTSNVNPNKSKKSKQEISNEAYQILVQRNKLDLELYDYAKKIDRTRSYGRSNSANIAIK